MNQKKGDSLPKRSNIFDDIKEKNLKVQKSDSEEEESIKAMFGEEKMNTMKELARKLSQKIAKNMGNSKESLSSSGNGDKGTEVLRSDKSRTNEMNSESTQSVSTNHVKSKKESGKLKKRKKGASKYKFSPRNVSHIFILHEME